MCVCGCRARVCACIRGFLDISSMPMDPRLQKLVDIVHREAWMKGLSVVIELQPQLFLDPTAGCFVTGFDCYERIKAELNFK